MRSHSRVWVVFGCLKEIRELRRHDSELGAFSIGYEHSVSVERREDSARLCFGFPWSRHSRETRALVRTLLSQRMAGCEQTPVLLSRDVLAVRMVKVQ